MTVLDKNGKEIHAGMHVIMPEPNETDIWNFGGFVPYVNDVNDDGTIIVEDGDSDFFQVEGSRVEIAE